MTAARLNLRHSDFSRLFKASPAAMAVSRLADGVFVEANRTFLHMHGYTREELIGHNSAELKLWRDPEARAEALETIRRQGHSHNFLHEFRHKSGRIGRAVVSLDVIEIEGVPYVFGTLTDVSELHDLRSSLAQTESRLNTALKISELVVFHQDRDLRYTWIANPALGPLPEEILGRSDEEILGVEGAQELTTIKRRVLRTGRGERHEVWLTREGNTGCFDLIVEPRRDPDGTIAGVVCAAADITARKRAQQELEGTTAQLQRLAAHLQDAIEAERSTLARDVHDELGAALTGIRLKLDALVRDLPRDDSACREGARKIAAMADRAMAVARDLCTRLRPPALDDLGLAETCRWYARDWSRTTGVPLRGRFEEPSTPPQKELRTDVFRILQELLTNVARHAGAKRVSVALGGGKSGLRLRVSDDGHGFDPQRTTSGFGLAGIRERVARHGGRVAVTSTPQGTTVIVTLPLPALAA